MFAPMLLPLLVLALLLTGCVGPADRAHLPVENATDRPLRIQVLDQGPDGSLRRRSLELPAGTRFALDLRFGRPLDQRGARFEVRTLDGAYVHARYVSSADALALRRVGAAIVLSAADLGMQAAAQTIADALAPIPISLADGKPALADEVDPAGAPAWAVDDDPKSFWRGLAPPPTQVSWAVDLGRAATVERAQLAVECVRCGFVRVRLTLLREPLPPAQFARPGSAQTESILNLIDGMSSAVVGTLELSGVVADGELLAAAPPRGIAGVRTVVATVVEAPENVGFYSVRLDGRWSEGG
jgi:hypothetical protein